MPTWKLERYVLGELPADELRRLRERVEVDADLRRQVEALQASDAEILRAFPSPWVARQVHSRAEAAPPSKRAWWRAGPGFPLVPVAAAALLALAVVPALRDSAVVHDATQQRFTTEGVRVKGPGARLFVHRKTATGSERLESGTPVRAGDWIRLQYDARGAAFGAILSIDGRGTVTRHLPETGDTAAALEQGGAVSLATSYELDNAPRWERFYLVTADAPFELSAVLSEARRAAAAAAQAASAPDSLRLSAALDQVGVTLRKPGGSR